MRGSWIPWTGVLVALALADRPAVTRWSPSRMRADTTGVSRGAVAVDAPGAAEPGGRITVRVTDAAGAPASSAVVDALWSVEGRAIPLGRAVLRADAEGGVNFEDVPAGRILLIASSPGQSRVSATVDTRRARAQTVTLVTGPEATLAGVVRRQTEREGEPTALAGVLVRAAPDGGSAEPAFITRTGPDGGYVFHGLRAGTWRVEVDDPSYEPVLRRAVPAPSRGVDLLLRAFATVRVLVRDGQGARVADARVSIAGSGVWPERVARSGTDGSVRLEQVPSGVYELRAMDGVRVAEPIAPFVLQPGDQRTATLTVTEGAALEGRVVDARTGAEIADARIIVAEDAVSSAPRAVVSEHDGAFRLAGMLRRPHVISARAEGYVPRVGDPVTPGSAGTVTVALDREVSVRGRVVDPRGAPIANAQVQVSALDLDGRATFLDATARAFREQLFEQQRGPGALRPAGELGVTTGRVPHVPTDPIAPRPAAVESGGSSGFVTDAQGRFRVGEIPPGAIRVSASHPAYVRGESALRAGRSGDELELEVILHPGGTIDGRLLDERGFPVANQWIEARIEHEPAPRRAFTARDGTFRIPSVLGRASVYAVIGGRALSRSEVHVTDGQDAPVTLRLDEGARRVRGRVMDGSGYPLPAAEVLLAGGGHSTRVVSNPDGTFDATIPGRGPLTVEARHPRFAPRTLTVTDYAQELSLALEPGATVTARVDGRGCARSDISVELRTRCGVVERIVRGEGSIRLAQVCPGRVDVAARATGCVPAASGAITVRSGERAELAPLELMAGGGVSGAVVDEAGERVAGAVITVAEVSGTVHARSDRQGVFLLDAVPEGERNLIASHPVLGRSEPSPARIVRGTTARGITVRFRRSLAEASVSAPTRWISLTVSDARVVVTAIAEGSPGARAGILVGDALVAIDGRAVLDADSAMRRVTSGEACVVELARDGQRRLARVLP
jgi:hypothetical protein